MRVFCFQDGYDLSNTPIQSSPGNWNEDGLKRIDLILAQAAQYGIYVIVVGTNFEPVGLQCGSCPGAYILYHSQYPVRFATEGSKIAGAHKF